MNGSRWTTAYRVAAVILLNTVVLLAVLELGASALLAVGKLPAARAWLARLSGSPVDSVSHYEALPYYAAQEWSPQYWAEFRRALTKTYSPYVVWRSAPFEGATIKIGDDGVRRTPPDTCPPDAYRVFAFGGSAMWGWGAPDWGTIPAYLQEALTERLGSSVCVTNFGENAYVSTQGVVQLQLLLQSGRIPDAVIFYDGVNEVLAASQTGRPTLHQNYSEIAALFDAPRHPLLDWIQGLRSLELLHKTVRHLGPPAGGSRALSLDDADALVDRVVGGYLNNVRMVGALAAAYGFSYDFFWQPHILVGAKPLAREEQELVTRFDRELNLDPVLTGLFTATYQRIASETSRVSRLHYLGDVFDGIGEGLWIDIWGHVTPDGNRLIARRIASTRNGSPGAPSQ